MRHIFGIIFKELSMSDDLTKRMKVDYWMMAKIARAYAITGETSIFYIVVMNMNIAINLQRLAKEFKHTSAVNIKFLVPDQRDFNSKLELLGQKLMDTGGLLVLENNKTVSNTQKQQYAEAVGKQFLKRYIKYKEKEAKTVQQHEIPVGIEWDYYGRSKI